MQHGFIKAAAATPQITVADCRANCQEIKKQIDLAQQQGVHLLVLPELCITGYTCGDLFFQSLLTDQAEQTLLDLYRERTPLYEKYADITINCSDISIREIVGLIAKKLNK